MRMILSLISGIAALTAYIPYIISIVRGQTRPERMSWFIWTVLGIIAFVSQLAEGARSSLWLVGVLTLGGLTIFLLSIRYGMGGILRRDLIALIFTIAGLGVWYLFGNPIIGLATVIAVGSASAFLTGLKAYQHPGTEAKITWLLASTAALLTIISLDYFTLSIVVYPTYIFLTNFGILLAAVLGQRKAAIRTA